MFMDFSNEAVELEEEEQTEDVGDLEIVFNSALEENDRLKMKNKKLSC